MDDKTLPTRQEDDFFTVLGNAFRLARKSWEALLLNLGTFIMVYVLPLIIVAAAFMIISGVIVTEDGGIDASSTEIIFSAIAGAGSLALLIMLMIATTITQLASVRGKKIGVQEVIDQSLPFFWRFAGLSLLSVLMIGIGLVFLIIPGLLIGALLFFAPYVMIDKNLGVIDTIKASFTISRQNWKIVMAFIVLQIVIQFPQIVPVLGAVVTTALSIIYFCLQAILYLRIAKASKKSAT